jgi:hypothetical protein
MTASPISVATILNRTHDELLQAEARMHAGNQDRLFFPHQRLESVCFADFIKLQEAGVSHATIADALEGILIAAKASQTPSVAPPIVGKWKVRLKTKTLEMPWICPLSRSFQNRCHVRGKLKDHEITEAKITNIESSQSVRITDRIIPLIRHGFFPKGDYDLFPENLIGCLELQTVRYEIARKVEWVYRTTFSLTQGAINCALQNQGSSFHIDESAVGFTLPYINHQHFTGHGLTTTEFSTSKEPLLWETMFHLRANYADWHGIEAKTIPLEQSRILKEDAEKTDQFMHIFNLEDRNAPLQVPQLGETKHDQIGIPGIYVFEKQMNTCAEIPPQASPQTNTKRDLAVRDPNKRKADPEAEPSSNKRIRWKPADIVPRPPQTINYCMFLPMTKKAAAIAKKHMIQSFAIDGDAVGCVLPYKDDPKADEKDALFLHIFNSKKRSESTQITTFTAKYPLEEPVKKVGIYVFQLPENYTQVT